MKIIGVTGGVAAGKSTFALKLARDLAKQGERVELLSSDDFLFPTNVLEERGLMDSKGFPESHDGAAFKAFLLGLKELAAQEVADDDPQTERSLPHPVYSHVTYDILPQPAQMVPPEVLIVEGVGVGVVKDLLDELIFIDTPPEQAFLWYNSRIYSLLDDAKSNPNSWYAKFLTLARGEFSALISDTWGRVNLKNYYEHILPLKEQADRVVTPAAAA
jgi:type I pantothenate kinase